MFHNVCRLCLGTEELLWIFNDKMASNMPEIIEVTSGVQITKSDTVTQMVCNTCCQITIKMFKFRTTSIKNDKDLKARCAGYNISQLRNSIVQTKQEISTSSAAVYAASHAVSLGENKTTINANVLSNTSPPPPPVPKIQLPQKYKFAHPSIKEIIKQNPNIQLPEVSPRSHFGAYITLLTDEVDDWYKERNFTDSEIAEIKKVAVSYAMELESPLPKPQRKKRRKSSIESACSSSSKKSSSDKSVTESGGSKRKKIKLNGDISSSSNADTTADIVKGNSVAKPKVNSLSKVVVSVTKSAVSTADKTNVDTFSKLSATSTTSDSNSNSKINANIKTSAKSDSNIPKWGADVKSNASVKSSVTSSTVNKQSAKNDVPTTETKETLHMGTVLHSLLTKEKLSKGRHEEITLSSILREGTKTPLAERASDSDGNDADDDPSYEPDAGDVGSDAEVIEIEEPGKKNVRPIRIKIDQPQNRNKPKDEYTLFTTRPFIRNATNVRQSKFRTQDSQDAELLVLSDSDDDGKKSTRLSNKKADSDNSDNSDPVIVDIDSSETSSLQSSKDNSDQNKATNMPDLSLVTVMHKSNTLFICKVCDGHYSNIKDLKVHERKTHTKCPFCNKKFRSLSSRDEHVKYTCIINNAPFQLKNLKLELTRVDEIVEIRKQYASAFEKTDDVTEETKSNRLTAEVSSTTTVSEDVPGRSPSLLPELPKENTGEITDCDKTVSELEEFLQTAPVPGPPLEQIPNITLTEGSSNNSETIAAESVAEVSSNCDIICISDDEADTSSTKSPHSKPKIKIINNDALKNINLQDHDINVLKNILANARLSKTRKTEPIDALKNNSIVDGGTSRVKVFKNLRKHLQHYKIPIEIQYSPNLNVEYKYATGAPRRKLTDLWHGMVPHDLKVPKMQLTQPPSSKNTAVATIPTYKNNVASIPTTHVKTASLVLHSQKSGGVVSQIVTSTNNIFNGVSQNPVFANMGQMTPIVSSAVTNSNKLIFTTQTQPVATSTTNDHSYSNRPVVLNNAQAVCSTTNNITNFILVSGALLPTTGKITESLPATQGPLPIIQYVTSAQEQPQTITITDETISPEESTTSNITTSTIPSVTTDATTATMATTNAGATQPAIRVKNLSELF